ncbi:hypothetical protein GIB67_034184 [Kingdonia uniflora]|uniref:MIF4G domain-containing protein n=1 Tax=Kingdonia uniflora TaxID=39325 RepID=A0A7J7NS42_9MAGN|nr:hypothetical protein GIB67_034184 [Kingdonia uniflora]
MAKTTEKSRKEKRKEARSTKKQTRHVSHINYQKTKRSVVDLKRAKFVKKSPLVAEKSSSIMEGPESPINEIPEKGVSQDFAGSGKEDTVEEQPFSSDVPKLKHKPSKNLVSKELINMEKKNSKRKKTKFEQLIEMENKGGLVSAEEDLRIERKLAKKLKVKQGKLRGEEDEMNSLFDDMPSVLGSLGDEQVPDDEEKKSDRSSSKKPKKRKRLVLNEERIEDKPSDNITSTGPETVISGTAVVKVEETCINVPAQGGNVKYIPPRLRDHARNESGDYTETCRLIRGLLNKLSDSNVEHVTMEICDKFKEVGRSIGTEILSKQVVSSVTEQHAAVFAAFVAGMACSVGIDFGAKLIVSLATCFEGEYRKEDNLSLRKLTLMLSYLCIFGVCASDLIYDFLAVLSKRLTEVDVSTILTILKYGKGGVEAIIRDYTGYVQGAAAENLNTSFVHVLELKAIETGLRLAVKQRL